MLAQKPTSDDKTTGMNGPEFEFSDGPEFESDLRLKRFVGRITSVSVRIRFVLSFLLWDNMGESGAFPLHSEETFVLSFGPPICRRNILQFP